MVSLLESEKSAETIVDDIIAYRDGLVDGMKSIAEIMNINSVKINTFKKVAEQITTRSNVFTVRCFAGSDRDAIAATLTQAEVVVDRSSTPSRVLYWYQGINN